MSDDTPQRRGGKARAERLSPEERKKIASQGAQARWGKLEAVDGRPIPKAIAMGVLRIGEIPCAVLDDTENTRVLTHAGFLAAIGRTGNPKSGAAPEGEEFLGNLPAFLQANNLKPFISDSLIESARPIVFETGGRGGLAGRAWGFRAQLLPDVCWVYAKAKMAGRINRTQEHVAEACTRLLEALTNVAIDSLVDEATGFQDMRAKDALIRLLEKYVSKDAFPWVKTFDADFYKEMFRLHGYKYDPDTVSRPMIFARRTQDIYDRLAPGVRKELQKLVKRSPSGRPREKLFQHLTENEGYRKLLETLAVCKAVMKLSRDYDEYEEKLDRVLPRFGDTYRLALDPPEA